MPTASAHSAAESSPASCSGTQTSIISTPRPPGCGTNWLREKAGVVGRAKDRHSVGNLHERDEKLESGRSLVRVSSAVSVTVPAEWNVQDFGRRLDASIRISGFTPLPLDGAHDAAVLPGAA